MRVEDFQTLLTVLQPIRAVISEKHPLARKKQLRLVDCLDFPLALPIMPYGVRSLMTKAASGFGIELNPAVQSDSFDFLRNFATTRNFISFQIQIGLPAESTFGDMVHKPINPEDLPPGLLHLTQLKGRTLPVAAARFVDQLVSAFVKNYDCV